MWVRAAVPDFGPDGRATVARIHAAEGDRLVPGGLLIDLDVDLSGGVTRDCPPVSTCRIVLRETLWLRRLYVRAGAVLAPGAPLADFADTPDAPHEPLARAARISTVAVVHHPDWWGAGRVIPLRFGPLEPVGATIRRSGLRWLHPDGHVCRAREVVAYCSLTVTTDTGPAFAGEMRDIQVAFAPRCAGRLRHAPEPWAGGYVDRVPIMRWDADAAWGLIEPLAPPPPYAGLPELMFLAGRRFVDLAEARQQLLTGWHDRTRVWWGDGPPVTLLAGGTCELRSVLQGDDGAFLPMFEEAIGPLHIVYMQDEPQVPCSRTLLEGIDRTSAERRAIREDLAHGLLGSPDPPRAPDWLFAGALLNALERSWIGDDYPVLTRNALLRTPPAAAVLLSLTAEMPHVLRHRRLGYTLNCHPFRLAAASKAIRRWLSTNFEIVTRTVADVRQDLIALRARLAGQATLVVVNVVETSNFEEIGNYALLDAETFAALGPRRAAALNLMLHDLAHEHDIAIVDADAQAAALGVAMHLPDGVHASRDLDTAVRGELIGVMAKRGFAGFALS